MTDSSAPRTSVVGVLHLILTWRDLDWEFEQEARLLADHDHPTPRYRELADQRFAAWAKVRAALESLAASGGGEGPSRKDALQEYEFARVAFLARRPYDLDPVASRFLAAADALRPDKKRGVSTVTDELFARVASRLASHLKLGDDVAGCLSVALRLEAAEITTAAYSPVAPPPPPLRPLDVEQRNHLIELAKKAARSSNDAIQDISIEAASACEKAWDEFEAAVATFGVPAPKDSTDRKRHV